ncbi:hypothetical protein MPTK1_2g04660 [Marchantia polymorpha subsp. ruderalis]|uniref:Uncharacterized protein n=1 Tax=Marchantia polymorpha TaxID=3197 RepID=A0A2R6X7T2_MARPO|nr:hypothetical protein MARPO_0031s0121 [Marchantia polymorpha]BBN01104.1 hypothetical protein Mp_2g04660 [Marchantia polymorpha subsp. ruderalis]|eukprot:PTQ42153.1 hypothetical protein MARPO_0031s0121 [Marchantia polymorpha]
MNSGIAWRRRDHFPSTCAFDTIDDRVVAQGEGRGEAHKMRVSIPCFQQQVELGAMEAVSIDVTKCRIVGCVTPKEFACPGAYDRSGIQHHPIVAFVASMSPMELFPPNARIRQERHKSLSDTGPDVPRVSCIWHVDRSMTVRYTNLTPWHIQVV